MSHTHLANHSFLRIIVCSDLQRLDRCWRLISSIQILLIEKMNRQINLLQELVDNHDSPSPAHSKQFSNSFILAVYFISFLLFISKILKITKVIRNEQIV